jgi:hypothetical protein
VRVLLCCLLVSATTTTLALTSEDLRQLYGAPTNVVQRRDDTPNSESFLLSPNIKFTVQYGADKQACVMTLEPEASQEREEHGEQVMSSTRISEILEQVAPADKRGEKPRDGSSSIACAGSIGVWSENYTNAYIRHDIRCGEGPNSERRVRVNFKREVCPKFEN